jgi:hypothetical protein
MIAGASSPLGAHPDFVGRSALRLEDPPLLTGEGRFVNDLSFPSQLHMRVVRSTHAHGRIVAVNAAAALAAPGVVAVWTSRDIADLPPVGLRGGIGTSQTDVARLTPYLQPVLARPGALYRRAGCRRLCRGPVCRQGRGRSRHRRDRGIAGLAGCRRPAGTGSSLRGCMPRAHDICAKVVPTQPSSIKDPLRRSALLPCVCKAICETLH